MAYENLCMYCFKDLNGETVCPHCGGDSRAAVPQVQILPGTLVYNDRFLIGRALGQDSSGIVYNAMDTKRGGVIRIREYLPRNCAERLNDGGVVPVAGMEEAFETGMRKLRASVDSVEDPKKRHFYFEENGTAYIAQRKGGSAPSEHREDEDEDEGSRRRQLVLYIAIAAAVVLAVAIVVILILNSLGSSDDRTTVAPLSSPSADATWAPNATPSPTPYATATFAALVDPELSWMDYTQPGAGSNGAPQVTPTPKPVVQGNQNYPTVNNGSDDASVRALQQHLVQLGWLNYNRVTGTYDAATKEAVRQFQHYVNESCSPAEKLVEDGIAGKKTQQWLYNSSISLTRPTATPEPKVTARPAEGTVDKNSSKAEVRDLQNKLITLGLMPAGSNDGKFGSATQSAVKSFQQRVNQLQGYTVLPVNGTADALTRAWLSYYAEEWARLHQATATPKPTATVTPKPTDTAAPAATNPNVDASASQERILAVQKLLQQVGLLSASDADGVYGIRTADAVRKFQDWVNQLRGETTLQVTGAVDPLTMRYLEYCVDNHRMYDLPTEAPTTQVPETPAPATEAPTVEPEITEVPPEQQAGDSGITPESPVESIEFMQEMLAEIGALDAGGITGTYDEATADAVRAFQQFVNDYFGDDVLEVSGQCDTDTLIYLQHAYDEGLNIAAGAATEAPTEEPAEEPTAEPTEEPTPEPTEVPTEAPTEEPKIDGVAPESPAEEILEMQRMLNQTGLLAADQLDGVYSAATEEAVRILQRAVNTYNGREVLEVSGRCDSQTLEFLQYAAGHGMDLRELGGVTPEPTDTPEPTEVPTPEPTEEPTPEPTEVPQVGVIEDLRFAVSGEEVSGTVELTAGAHRIDWGAKGDLQSYWVYLYDGNGNVIQSAENTPMTGFDMSTDSMMPGEVYQLRVGALPVNGGEGDIYWQSLNLLFPVVATPEPTEAPTPAPSVSEPVITIGSAVYQRDGVQYIDGETAIFSWMADGEVESYTVNLIYQEDNTSFPLGTTTDTSKTVNTDQLKPGLYRLYVGATPVGGGEDSTVWSELVFGVPAPEVTPEPEPEITAAPEPPAGQRIDYIDANSSAENVETVQMALYSFGLLDAQSVQPGMLDRGTLEAVAAFQQKVNELYGQALYVIDPEVDQFIDAQTLDLLLYQNLDFSAQEQSH